ncbi:hypothetical protein SDC9_96976 [bioreactor metagenome]|uniref:Uncharacterized protein n=1 Tax=bioreactor metagenome TaxID=1076179 RepID=A0A645AAL4_9ZZZZ
MTVRTCGEVCTESTMRSAICLRKEVCGINVALLTSSTTFWGAAVTGAEVAAGVAVNVGIGRGSGLAGFLASMKFITSSLVMRPSMPVPVTRSRSTLFCSEIFLTSGLMRPVYSVFTGTGAVGIGATGVETAAGISGAVGCTSFFAGAEDLISSPGSPIQARMEPT